MKIARIKFKNINSLRGEHEVDFEREPLGSAGIFAITGPTGSGKTTILDVMVLALYNKVPRIGDIISNNFMERAGALITRNTTDAYAEIEYECSTGRYISKWSVNRARTGRIQQHQMQLFEVATGKQLDYKSSEVAERNVELIGLNYEQFIRSILLAQGDFARFLKSDKKERTALLEKITGADIYRRIGRRVYEKTSAVKKEADDIQIRIGEIKALLMGEEELTQLRSKLADAEDVVRRTGDEISKGKKILEVKESIAKLEQRIVTERAALAKAAINLETFVQMEGARMKQHRELLPIEQQLLGWERKLQEVQRHAQQQQALQQDIAQVQQQQATQQQTAALLLKEPLTEHMPEEKLNALLQRVDALDKEKQAVASAFKEKQGIVNATGKPIGFVLQPKELAAQSVAQQAELNETRNRYEALRKTTNAEVEPEAAIRDINAALKSANEIASDTILLNRNEQERNSLQEALPAKQHQADVLPGRIASGRQEWDKLGVRILLKEKDLEISSLKQELDTKRHLLTEGEPCPLCGALHHPSAGLAALGWCKALRREIAALKQEQAGLLGSLSTDEANLKFLEGELKEIQAKLHKLSVEIEKQHTALADKRIGLPSEVRQLPVDIIIGVLEEKLAAVNQLAETETRLRILEAIAPELAELMRLAEKGKQVAEQRNALYSGTDIVGEVHGILTKASVLRQQLQAAEAAFAKWQAEEALLAGQLQQMEAQLNVQTTALGYETLAAARQKLLSAEVFSGLQRKNAELEQQHSNIKVALEGLGEQLQALQKKDIPMPAEELQQNLAGLQQQLQLAEASRDEISFKTRQQSALANDLKLFTDRLVAINSGGERWLLLARFIDADAKGERFSAFAQQLTLERLVSLANHRLMYLNKRYSLAVPSDSEDDSLVICDADMGGNRRSVKTLSGGESFLISLSLALALSDLASNTVEIKSLFIDEGFGTLDPATLEQTLDTLERLQMESNKTIGIISHVDALKERISTKIQIVQNGHGFSTLNIA